MNTKDAIIDLTDVAEYLQDEWDDVTIVEAYDPIAAAMEELSERGRRTWALVAEVL